MNWMELYFKMQVILGIIGIAIIVFYILYIFYLVVPEIIENIKDKYKNRK